MYAHHKNSSKIPMQSQHYPLNTLFKPSPSMKTWYRGGIALFPGLILLFTYVPLVLFAELPAVLSFVIALIFRQIDPVQITFLPMGSHFLWHSFSAVGTYFILNYLYVFQTTK